MAEQIAKPEQDQIVEALLAGQKDQAIQIYRDATGCDPQTAEQFVNAILSSLNNLQKTDPCGSFAKFCVNGVLCGGRFFFLFLLTLVLLGIVKVLWF